MNLINPDIELHRLEKAFEQNWKELEKYTNLCAELILLSPGKTRVLQQFKNIANLSFKYGVEYGIQRSKKLMEEGE